MILSILIIIVLIFFFYIGCGKDGWRSKWVKSDWKISEGKSGSFKHTAGTWAGDPDDKGLTFGSLHLYA